LFHVKHSTAPNSGWECCGQGGQNELRSEVHDAARETMYGRSVQFRGRIIE
jgi:hypothetical protein